MAVRVQGRIRGRGIEIVKTSPVRTRDSAHCLPMLARLVGVAIRINLHLVRRRDQARALGAEGIAVAELPVGAVEADGVAGMIVIVRCRVLRRELGIRIGFEETRSMAMRWATLFASSGAV